ncbi:MAG: phytanoyl-CoA dioxygenase family protein [Caulobacterales bacterium]
MIPDFTPDQRDQFARSGVVRLPGLLDPQTVRRARELVLHRLEATGLWRDGAWRLDALPKPAWPDNGLRKPSKVIGNKHPQIEALADDPAVGRIVSELLGGRACDRSIYRRPMTLFTLPNIETWALPTIWHTDVPRLASGETPGVQMFTFLEPVGPCGGGTCVIAGSHRLLNEGRVILARDLPRELRDEPFFRDLFAGRFAVDGAHAAMPAAHVANVRLEVMELTGEPGDVWLMDLRTFHAAAPNASGRPRVMVTDRFVRADLVPEIARASGWR